METKTDLEAKLIDLMETRTSLYEKKDPNHFNTKIREAKWKEIQDGMKLTVKECQTLWTSLRQQYCRYIRKLKLPSGSATGRPPYFRHSERMQFLKDTVDPNESTRSNLDEDLLSLDNDTSNDCTFNDVEIEVVDIEKFPEDSSVVPRSKLQGSRTHVKFGKKRKLDAFDQEILGLLKSDEDDEFESYGKMLATKFKKISDIDRKEFVKLQAKINLLVTECELEMLN